MLGNNCEQSRRCIHIQSLIAGIPLHMKHTVWFHRMGLHGSTEYSEGDGEAAAPWIIRHVIGPDTRIMKETLCAGRMHSVLSYCAQVL